MAGTPKAEPNLGWNVSRLLRWAKRLVAAIAPPRRIAITIETNRVVIIRRRRVTRVWCPECGCEVNMVGLGEAEALTGESGRDCAQARRWHLCEAQDGTRLVCLESLRAGAY